MQKIYDAKRQGKNKCKIQCFKSDMKEHADLQELSNFDAISLYTLFENIATDIAIFEHDEQLRTIYISLMYYKHLLYGKQNQTAYD